MEGLIAMMREMEVRLRALEARLNMSIPVADHLGDIACLYRGAEVADVLEFPSSHAFTEWLKDLRKKGVYTEPPRYWWEPKTRRRYRVFTAAQVRRLRDLKYRTKKRFADDPLVGLIRASGVMDDWHPAAGGGRRP